MNGVLTRFVCVMIGYVFGLFQTAFIYGKMHGIDIRKHGSGNSGTTNALRVLGNGEISKAVTVKATYFSPSAKEKIEKAGGKAELV